MARRGAATPRRDDEDRLLHYVATVDRCISRRAVQERTLRARFSIRSTIGEPVEVEADHGDEEDVRSLMLEFRKLLAKDDDAHFFGICNLVERRVDDSEMLTYTRSNRDNWKVALSGAINFEHNGRSLRGESLMDAWINGVLFHSDPAMAAVFEALPHMLSAMMYQDINSMIIECLRAAHAQRNVVNEILENGLLV